MTRFLIIGGGIAGTTAAEEIRKQDPKSEITIIEQEQHPCYSRVLLPHYITGKVIRDRVFIKKPDWYKEQKIELQAGVRAVEIDVENMHVRTSQERELPYDKLLITSGGELNLIPDDKRGLSYLRTIDDADHLLQLLGELEALPKKERQAIVLGGGFIALEYINIFAKFELPTIVVKHNSGFWSSIISPASQNVLHQQAVKNGVKVITNEPSCEIVGDKELEGLRLSDGTVVSAKIMGVGIGTSTDKSLLTDAGIEVDRGILANEYLETSVENVYTAGDVAEFYDVTVDRRLRLGNWMNAMQQARAVVKTMAGERTKFELVSSYATNLLGLKVVFVGDVSRQHADEVIQHVDEEDRSTELFIRNGRLVGAVLLGDVLERQAITNAIKEKKMYDS